MNIEKLLEELIDAAEILGFFRFEYEKGHVEFDAQFIKIETENFRCN